jgi:hypothetical protein
MSQIGPNNLGSAKINYNAEGLVCDINQIGFILVGIGPK